jgi:Holliday junction resolvase
MKSAPIEKGIAAERLIRTKLRDMGYIVMRSAASRGPIDLLAANEHERLAIQVKAGRRRPSKAELEEVYRASQLFNAQPMIAMKHHGRWWLWLVQENLDIQPLHQV